MLNIIWTIIPTIWLAVMPADTTSTKSEIILHRLRGEIVLDGLSNEAAWQEVEPLPLTMFTPTFRSEPTERTEIRVAYDDKYIYVAGRLYTSEPSGIQANSLTRDSDKGGDFFNFLLDTFNDNENLVGFFTTPAGNRLDAELINDAEGQGFLNQDWNAFWDSAVVQNEQGWFAEMRIPFTSLRFQSDSGRVVFGMMVHRLIGRKNERLTFPEIPPNWSASQWKASLAQDVVLYGVQSRRPLYFSPYLLGGLRHSSKRMTDQTGPSESDDLNRDAGFDLKYGLSNNITLDLTVNTDFAQVEADDERFNSTRFSLFFPEKRQFFQERSGIFSFKTGGFSRLFHSRKIGLNDEGEPVRIFGGARVVGRLGDLDFGLLSMQTEKTQNRPTENFGVFRLRRRILNPYSFLGGMFTSRIARGGRYNINYGLDTVLRIGGNDYLTINWAQTFENESSPLFKSTLQRVSFERRNIAGLGFDAALRHIGETFSPEVGFITRTGVYEGSGGISHGWFFGETSRFRRHSPFITGELVVRNSDDRIESSQLWAGWEIESKPGTLTRIALHRQSENLLRPFDLSGVEVPAGDYIFYSVKGTYNMSAAFPLRTNLEFEAGTFFDGNRLAFAFKPTWNQSRYLELSAGYELNRIRLPGQGLDAQIISMRIQAALNIHLSANALIQYSNVTEQIGLNTRIRYNFREGHDLYLVYNDTRTESPGQDSILPDSERTLMVKYIYTLLR